MASDYAGQSDGVRSTLKEVESPAKGVMQPRWGRFLLGTFTQGSLADEATAGLTDGIPLGFRERQTGEKWPQRTQRVQIFEPEITEVMEAKEK